MPVHIIYPGQTEPRLWARDHWCGRLYNRKIVRFHDSNVYDTVVTEGHSVGRIKAPIHHYSIRSSDHMKAKLNERMSGSDQNASIKSSAAFTLVHLTIEFPMNFYKYYIVRRHVTGGFTSLRYASTQAWYRSAKLYRRWRQQRTPHTQRHAPLNDDDFTTKLTSV